MKQIITVLSSILTLTLLSGCGFSLAQDITPPPGYTPPAPMPTAAGAGVFPVLPPNPSRGELVYQEQCANCHGKAGIGDGANASNLPESPAQLIGSAANYIKSLSSQFDTISNGIPGSSMPGFESTLDDRARWDVAGYVYLMNTSPEKLAAGREIYNTVCSDCHGPEGKGNGIAAKSLPLQPPDFTDQSILPARSDHELVQIVTMGSSNVMPAFDQSLSDTERALVVSYIRSLSFTGVEIPEIVLTEESSQAGSTPVGGSPSATIEPVAMPTNPAFVSIAGQVINDSGAALTDRLPVELLIFDEMQQTGSLKTTTLLDGSFTFNDVEIKPGRIFISSATYKGQVFNSQPSFHSNMADEAASPIDQGQFQMDIHVYETSSDISTVKADRMHVFLDFTNPGVVQVVELFILSNSSLQVVMPSTTGQGLIDFHLPKEATNLQFQDGALGDRYLPIENGFSDTQAIQPGVGSGQVLFAFDLPYKNKLDLVLPIPLDTSSISVMVPVDGVNLKSSKLADGGIRESEGMSFRLYTAENLQKDSDLKLSLSGKGTNTDPTFDSSKINPVLFGAGVFMLVVTAVGFYFYRRQERTTRTEVAGRVSENDKDTLIDAIISLDESYKSGKLNEAVYQQRRAELKEKLRKLS